MHIENLSLYNFRNYEEAYLEFSDKVNCIVGPNGSGKTNILDALHYLSLTKSALNSTDTQNIRFEQDLFSIKGRFIKNNKPFNIVCAYDKRSKKSLKVDKKEYEKLSNHIGEFPLVLVAPNDSDLIRDSSEVRRRFFDSVISQTDKNYLNTLIRYNHFLKQRNVLLKNSANGSIDLDLLSLYDKQLLSLGHSIFASRNTFILEFTKELSESHSYLSDDQEQVSIVHKSDYHNADFENEFKAALPKDRLLERTTLGVHRDDYKFLINDIPLKKFGSQGQQKTFIIALKLAQFGFIKKNKNLTPLLLLDDIFDKLDAKRVARLLNLVSDQVFGQIFITDAREDRTESMLSQLGIDARVFTINNGIVE